MIDLHVHTNASDGQYSPSEVVRMAKNIGVSTIAITDHDTVSGVNEAMLEGEKCGVEVIPGIEFSAEFKNNMHILGYFVDHKSQVFSDFINDEILKRRLRNLKYIEYFKSIGFNISEHELNQIAKGTIGKPHFVKLMLDKGYIKSQDEGYKQYFSREPLKSICKERKSPKEIIEMILSVGGIPVLAHPVLLKLSLDELENEVSNLKSFGLLGIEVYHTEHSPNDTLNYLEIAKKHSLVITGGTDYHGDKVKPEIKLGTGCNGNVNILDYSIVTNLKSKIFRG